MFNQATHTTHQIEGTTKNGRSLLIRPATHKDRDAVIQNINMVGAEKVYLPSDSYVSTPAWEALFEKNDKSRCLLLVVEVDGRIIGHGRLLPCGFNHKDSHVVDVGLALTKDFRGGGIGTQLLARMIEWAEFSGYEKVTAVIMSNNGRSLRLFRQAGFVEEGIKKCQFKIADYCVDEILVALFLPHDNTI